MSLAEDRTTYAALQASCARYTPKQFNDVAWRIAYELSDGEEITSSLWIQAARQICAGCDHA